MAKLRLICLWSKSVVNWSRRLFNWLCWNFSEAIRLNLKKKIFQGQESDNRDVLQVPPVISINLNDRFEWILLIWRSSNTLRFWHLLEADLPYTGEGASQVVLPVRNLPASAGDVRDTAVIPGSGRSPGEGHGNPLQYSCLENPMTEEAGGLQSIGSQRVGHG